MREEEPGDDADRRRDDTGEQRLGEHHAEHLPARCAEGSQQRQLACALREMMLNVLMMM